MIEDLRSEFGKLMRITTDGESRAWLQILMRNIDTLEDRVDDIRTNLEAENSYDMNIEMLDNNIYIMTELVQDNIQSYIYYQTKSIEHLTQQLNDSGAYFHTLLRGAAGIAGGDGDRADYDDRGGHYQAHSGIVSGDEADLSGRFFRPGENGYP